MIWRDLYPFFYNHAGIYTRFDDEIFFVDNFGNMIPAVDGEKYKQFYPEIEELHFYAKPPAFIELFRQTLQTTADLKELEDSTEWSREALATKAMLKRFLRMKGVIFP